MASSSRKTIPYRPLDPSRAEIRVISMSPESDLADGSIDSSISISLHTVSLNDPSLKYFALSYVWGDANNTTTITVDGAPFQATTNLAAALRVFGTTFGAEPNMFLWVDAVCINQDDMSERIAQVELMGRIYRQTRRVLIWLGPGDDHVRALFTFLRVWSRTLQAWVAGTGSLEPRPQLLAELDKVMNTSLDVSGLRFASSEEVPYGEIGVVPTNTSTAVETEQIHPIDTLIEVFVNRPYWSRTWTFQELQLPEDGVLICGNDIVVGLSEVSSVFLWLNRISAQLVQQGRLEEISPAVWGVLVGMVTVLSSLPYLKQLALMTQMQKANSQPATINLLLRATQFREATNPRDLYFGMLGVADLPGMKVDYAASVEQVFTGASEILCNGGSEMLTYLLSYAGTATPHWRKYSSLPSWATTRGTIESMFLREIFWMNSHAGDGGEATASCTIPTVLDDDRTLLCEGIVVDTIDDEAVKSFRSDETTKDNDDLFACCIDETVSFFFGCPPDHFLSDIVAQGTPYAGGGTQFAALMRFWLQDHLSSGSDGMTSFNDILGNKNLEKNFDLLDTIQIFLLNCCIRDRDVTRLLEMKGKQSQEDFGRSVLRTHQFIVDGFVNPRLCQFSSVDSAAETCSTTWDDVLRFISYQRRAQLSKEDIFTFKFQTFNLAYAALFRTAAGYIGVARSGIKRGDKLCVLAGADVPVVLRPTAEEGFYELVSYAFAVGLMNGEAWNMGGKEAESFLIR